jgi:hypothetical protein
MDTVEFFVELDEPGIVERRQHIAAIVEEDLGTTTRSESTTVRAEALIILRHSSAKFGMLVPNGVLVPKTTLLE